MTGANRAHRSGGVQDLVGECRRAVAGGSAGRRRAARGTADRGSCGAGGDTGPHPASAGPARRPAAIPYVSRAPASCARTGRRGRSSRAPSRAAGGRRVRPASDRSALVRLMAPRPGVEQPRTSQPKRSPAGQSRHSRCELPAWRRDETGARVRSAGPTVPGPRRTALSRQRPPARPSRTLTATEEPPPPAGVRDASAPS